ncbi:stage II sporulation protein P [Bacillus salitolerans]|uniref:Stage II sporulation protein P n=1 Tax=Bacillus salitolerans TaxID=1437434 RepID=A0ABW4LQH3_9BACI
MTIRNNKILKNLLYLCSFLLLMLIIYITLLKITYSNLNPERDIQSHNKYNNIQADDDKKSNKMIDDKLSKQHDEQVHPASIEVTPRLDTLKNNKPLLIDRNKIKSIDKQIKSPVINEGKFHSTFGKEVIFIYFTHNRESFLPYFPKDTTPDEAYHSEINISLVGERLQHSLRLNGIWSTVFNNDIFTILDILNLDFSHSYAISREMVKKEKKSNKSLVLFFDLHRDSLTREYTTTSINGNDYAKLLFVIGNGHTNYKENLAFANELHELINMKYPGLSKGVMIKDTTQGNGVYNQDLSPGSVIIEIGGVENSFEELFRSADVLGYIVGEYYWENYH